MEECIKNSKVCTKCLIEKNYSDFNRDKWHKDGRQYRCRDCEKILYHERKGQKMESLRIYRKKYPEKRKVWDKKYQKTNKYRNSQSKYVRLRRKRDVQFNIGTRMSRNINKSLKGNKRGRKWETLVGYTVKDLEFYLKSKFTNSMTWEKFLNGDIVIDHVIPKTMFIYKNTQDIQFKYCWELKNLQPLWHDDNERKSDYISDGRRSRYLNSEEKLDYLKSLGYNFENKEKG